MKKNLKTIALSALSLLMLNACDKVEEQALVNLSLKINMPEGFETLYEGEVKIASQDLKKSYTAMAEKGVVLFEEVYSGLYDLQISTKMTKEEAEAAAPELGIKSDIIINGFRNGMVVNPSNANQEVNMTWSLESKLLISKIYCNGTKLNSGKNENGPAKYYEIFNNSSEVQYLDGLCLAAAHGLGTGKNDCALYVNHKNEATYAGRIAKLPGKHGVDKNIPLEPGKSFVIAWNARNFIKLEDSSAEAKDKCTMTFDLTGADYEIDGSEHPRPTFVDNPDVPDMPYLHDCFANGGGFYDMHQSMFIFFANEDDVAAWETGVDDTSYMGAAAKWPGKRVANDLIIDAVETFKIGAGQHKRIADVLDAAGVESNDYEAALFNRRIQTIENGRIILMDTNNSKNDFVVVGSANKENFDGSHLKIRDYSHPEIQPGR